MPAIPLPVGSFEDESQVSPSVQRIFWLVEDHKRSTSLCCLTFTSNNYD